MAITITVAQLASAIRVGDTAEETAEVTRLRTYAITEIERYLGDAFDDTPDEVANEATVRLVAYLYDQPTTARAAAFANAMRNSGAGRMLLGYRVHRAGSTGEAVDAAVAGSLGLVQIGSQAFDVATANEWFATDLPAPKTDIAGLSVVGPDGREDGIELFRTAQLAGTGVAGADATDSLDRKFALETASDGTVLFGSQETGQHTVYLYEVR